MENETKHPRHGLAQSLRKQDKRIRPLLPIHPADKSNRKWSSLTTTLEYKVLVSSRQARKRRVYDLRGLNPLNTDHPILKLRGNDMVKVNELVIANRLDRKPTVPAILKNMQSINDLS